MGRLRNILLENLVWFGISLVLAFFVWFIATVQADPIQQSTFRTIPILITPDEGYIVTNDPTDNALVNIRAQRSVLAALTRDDIIISADLSGRTAGTHTVPLLVRVNRPGIITRDTQPTQITVTLERIEAGQKPINLVVINPPPADFAYDTPVADIFQAEVRGAMGQVTKVVAVQGEIDLSNRRNPLDMDIQLIPVDASGQPVENVTVTPLTARVNINIYSRPDVRQVTVRPNIRFDTLLPGYVFESIRTTPQIIYLSGSPSELERVGDTIDTLPIDLTGHTSDFEITVPLELPPGDLLILSGENQVKVNVGITALVTARQFDNIPVDIIGQPENARVTLTPPTISVVLNAPLTMLDEIADDDIQAIIDVNRLAAGNYESQPQILIRQGQITVNGIQILPPAINVSIVVPTPTPEATAETDSP